MKWFKNPQTIEELKKQYRNLAMANHPDRGGKEADMKEINFEYDQLFEHLKNIHKSATGETYTAKEETTETPEEFKDIINALIHLSGLIIEICGSWIWITGNTLQHKEALKELRFRWSKTKQAWYYHNEGYRKHNNKQLSLDEIRDLYGSEKVKTEKQMQLAVN